MSGNKVQSIRDRFSDPLLTALTILLAILLFVVGPLQATGRVEAHYFGLAFAPVLIVAVFAVSASTAALIAMMSAVALIGLATFLRFRSPSEFDIYLDASAWLITGITLATVVARAVFAPGEVTYHRVLGAVLLYLTIGLIFTALYCFVALHSPAAFNGIGPLHDDLAVAGNLIYFSFVTLTSVGYGDVVPLHPIARGLSNVEAIIGQLYPATLLARLVSLELETRRR
jgi:hypothetical protein